VRANQRVWPRIEGKFELGHPGQERDHRLRWNTCRRRNSIKEKNDKMIGS